MNKSNRKSVTRRANLRKESTSTGIINSSCIRCEADVTVTSGEVRLELSYSYGQDFKLAIVGGASQVSAKQGSFEKIPELYHKVQQVDQENLVATANELGREVKSCIDYVKEQIKEAPGVIENVFAMVMKTKRCDTELREYREAHEVQPTKAEVLKEGLETLKAEEAYNTNALQARKEEALKRERIVREHNQKLRELDEEFAPVE